MVLERFETSLDWFKLQYSLTQSCKYSRTGLSNRCWRCLSSCSLRWKFWTKWNTRFLRSAEKMTNDRLAAAETPLSILTQEVDAERGTSREETHHFRWEIHHQENKNMMQNILTHYLIWCLWSKMTGLLKIACKSLIMLYQGFPKWGWRTPGGSWGNCRGFVSWYMSVYH